MKTAILLILSALVINCATAQNTRIPEGNGNTRLRASRPKTMPHEPRYDHHYDHGSCTMCCPEMHAGEIDPNAPFREGFRTHKSYGRYWVNGYYCGTRWIAGHWHYDPELKPGSAADEGKSGYKPPQYSSTDESDAAWDVDFEELYSLPPTKDGRVWIRPYTLPDGTFVPGHWKE